MDQDILNTINKRLEALEVVHTRYQGPKGPKGDKGDAGPAGRDGKDSGELDALREERHQFHDELNNFRKGLQEYGIAFEAQMRDMHRLALAELTDVSNKGAEAFRVGRDEAVAAVNKDYSAELNAMRELRNECRDELNDFRRELHDFRTSVSTEIRELCERTQADLADMYKREVEAFCAIRDQAWEELKAAAPQGPQGPQGERGETGPQGPQAYVVPSAYKVPKALKACEVLPENLVTLVRLSRARSVKRKLL